MAIEGVKKENKVITFDVLKYEYPIEIECAVRLMNNMLAAFANCSYEDHMTKYVIHIKFSDYVVPTYNEIFELGVLFGKLLREN